MLYIVRPGDSLWRIAARTYGDGRRWVDIARANWLNQSDMLVIGQKLTLPQSSARANARDQWGGGDASLSVSGPHRPAAVPAINYVFVLADEINPLSRKVVRRVIVSPRMAAEAGAKLGRPLAIFPNPERFGFHPTDAGRALTSGRHALGVKPSPFSSAAEGVFGARRFVGEPFYIDVAKAKAAGATIHETNEIVASLESIASREKTSAGAARVRAYKAIVTADREVLVKGVVPASAVKGIGAMATTRVLQGVQVVGFTISAYKIEQASEKSIRTQSVKPLGAAVIREGGGWASAWAGAQAGALAGAAVGIETGPGAILTGAAGALIFGTAGYFGFDWIADHIDED